MPITSPQSYSFKAAFSNYGETTDTLSDEIRADIKRLVVEEVKSRPFDMAEGFGIETIENESQSFLNNILYKTQLATAIANYNQTVPFERQVITGQELILIEQGDEASEMEINILYFEARNFNVVSPPSLQQLLVKLNQPPGG